MDRPGRARDRLPSGRRRPRPDQARQGNAQPDLTPDAREVAAAPGPAAADPPDSAGELPRLYTPAAAAKLLAVPESWLRGKAAARAIPCTLLGKHLRFSRLDLAAIITAGARPAIRGHIGARPTLPRD